MGGSGQSLEYSEGRSNSIEVESSKRKRVMNNGDFGLTYQEGRREGKE